MLAAALLRFRRAKPQTSPRKLLEQNHARIARIAERIALRGGFRGTDVEDFVSEVWIKLFEDDCAVMHRHKGASTLESYLVVVIQNLLHDERNRKWGRYRPSAAARRLGTVAVRLERLMVLEGMDAESAIRALRTRDADDPAHALEQLRKLAEQLPPRQTRSFVGEEVLAQVGIDGAVEARVEATTRTETVSAVRVVLSEALAELSTQDRLLLEMHLGDGMTIARIAGLLGVEQRKLYTRRDKLLRDLRGRFEAAGLTWERVRSILGWADSALEVDFGA